MRLNPHTSPLPTKLWCKLTKGSQRIRIPDELSRTFESHLWLANLEKLAGTTPTMSTTSQLPQQPHPDGPTTTTRHQLEHKQNALVRAHEDNDVSRTLRGVVSNMHLLALLSRERHLIVILAQCGTFKWIWTRTCPRRVPWP